MYMVRLLFTFGGTINRREWWIGTLSLIAAIIACMIVFTPQVFSDDTPYRTMPSFLLGLAFAYPAAVLLLKRIADIGWPGWVAYAGVALSVLLVLLEYPGNPMSEIDQYLLAANLVFLAAEIAVCGFIRGKADTAPQPPSLQAA